MKRESRRKGFLILAVVLLVWAFWRMTDGGGAFTFESLKDNRDVLKAFAADRPIQSVLAYMALYVAAVSFALPGAAVLSMAGGFLFGTAWGVLIINVSATLGAAASFLIARYVAGDLIQVRFADRLKGFNREVAENGTSYFLTVRLIPAFPFFLVNLFAGITRIPFWKFIGTTALGIVPGSFVYAYAGSNLGRVDRPGEIFSREMIFALLLLALLALVPVFYRKLKKGR